MEKHNEQFIPEMVDEQIDELLQSQSSTSSDAQMVHGLSRLYTEKANSLDHGWHRLGLDAHTHMSFFDAVQQMRPSQEQMTGETRMIVDERNHRLLLEPHNKITQRQFGRSFAVLAAVLVAALLVGSVLLIVNRVTHSDQGVASSHTFNQPQGSLSQTPSGFMAGPQGPNLAATTEAIATATAKANIILEDPLTDHRHNWPLANAGALQYKFENGAYHVIVNDKDHAALPLLPGETFNKPMAYTLTMQEVRGDDTSPDNWFGLVMRFSQNKQNGRTVQTFYCFGYEPADGMYQFRMYNNGFSANASAWTDIWHTQKGREYHTGHGAQNMIKVFANGNDFTFFVNGKQVGEARDNSLSSGQIGMVVNQQGAEVAFSHLILTYH
jgi:hypothetical protein